MRGINFRQDTGGRPMLSKNDDDDKDDDVQSVRLVDKKSDSVRQKQVISSAFNYKLQLLQPGLRET